MHCEAGLIYVKAKTVRDLYRKFSERCMDKANHARENLPRLIKEAEEALDNYHALMVPRRREHAPTEEATKKQLEALSEKADGAQQAMEAARYTYHNETVRAAHLVALADWTVETLPEDMLIAHTWDQALYAGLVTAPELDEDLLGWKSKAAYQGDVEAPSSAYMNAPRARRVRNEIVGRGFPS
jgi:hypothetical protein